MSLVERLNAEMLPFAKLMGVVVTEAAPDRVAATLTIRDDLCTTNSIAHGGAVMALADTLGGIAAFINLPPDAKGTTTIESKTNMIGAAPVDSTLIAVCAPLHRGRRTQIWQTRIETSDGKLIAVTIQTQLTL